MSDSYTKADLESRLAMLEKRLETQDKKIRRLGTILAISQASPFDSPWNQFLDAADSFWTDIYEDKGALHNQCIGDYQKDLATCGSDEDCIAAAEARAIVCHAEIGDL